MSSETDAPHQHVAMPKLMGAPAYARPPRVVEVPVPRPIDPDDLPIEAERTDEERELAAAIGPDVMTWLPGHGRPVQTDSGSESSDAGTPGIRSVVARLGIRRG